jgi:multisubunit Na+/H+ antiporter MnhF subunit
VIDVALAVLALTALVFTARIVLGPTLADRVVALDGLLTTVVAAIAAVAAREREPLFLGVLVVVALVGFVGTSIVARFIERRGA